MPYSDPQQQREAQAAWYKKNIELTHSRTKKWREENPEQVRQYRNKANEYGKNQRRELILYKGGKCEHCGFEDDGTLGFLLDFHHIDPEKKKFGISAGNLRKKMSKLIKEADKCELLCVMCHRMEHHKRTTELLK